MEVPTRGARQATLADQDVLESLQREARTGAGPARGGMMLLTSDRPWSRCAEETRVVLQTSPDDTVILLGTLDEVPVGYAMVHAHDIEGPDRVAVVDELFVTELARELGVGEELMRMLSDWARTRGCTALDAVALPGDRATKNFFEQHLMAARLLVMHRRL